MQKQHKLKGNYDCKLRFANAEFNPFSLPCVICIIKICLIYRNLTVARCNKKW